MEHHRAAPSMVHHHQILEIITLKNIGKFDKMFDHNLGRWKDGKMESCPVITKVFLIHILMMSGFCTKICSFLEISRFDPGKIFFIVKLI